MKAPPASPTRISSPPPLIIAPSSQPTIYVVVSPITSSTLLPTINAGAVPDNTRSA